MKIRIDIEGNDAEAVANGIANILSLIRPEDLRFRFGVYDDEAGLWESVFTVQVER